MRRAHENVNHIRWQTGHLVYSAGLLLKLLGETADIPEEWNGLFGYGSTLQDDKSVYPSMTDLKTKLYELYEQTFTALDNLPVERMDEEVDLGEDWKAAPAEGALYLCAHEFYHAGQITVMRRVLGRDKPFG